MTSFKNIFKNAFGITIFVSLILNITKTIFGGVELKYCLLQSITEEHRAYGKSNAKELSKDSVLVFAVQVVAMIFIGFGSINLLIIAIVSCKQNDRGFYDFVPFWIFFQVLTSLVDAAFIITSIVYALNDNELKLLKVYVIPIQTMFLIVNLAMLITVIDKLRSMKITHPHEMNKQEMKMMVVKNAFPRSSLFRLVLHQNDHSVTHASN